MKTKVLSPLDRAIDELMAQRWALVQMIDRINSQVEQLERVKNVKTNRRNSKHT